MALEPAPAIRRPVTLTPLIDVIFLLLLFFMLSSTFTRFGEVPLANAGGGAVTDGAPPLFLQLRAEDLSLNGSALTLDALVPALGERAAEGATTVLLVTVAEDVTSQRLVDLLTHLRGLPDLAVSILD